MKFWWLQPDARSNYASCSNSNTDLTAELAWPQPDRRITTQCTIMILHLVTPFKNGQTWTSTKKQTKRLAVDWRWLNVCNTLPASLHQGSPGNDVGQTMNHPNLSILLLILWIHPPCCLQIYGKQLFLFWERPPVLLWVFLVCCGRQTNAEHTTVWKFSKDVNIEAPAQ